MAIDKRSIRTEALDDVQVELSLGAALVDASNPLPVTMTDADTLNDPQAENLASASLAPGASETLVTTAFIPNLDTGRLQQVTISSDGAWVAVVSKDPDGITPIPIATLRGDAGSTVVFTPKNAHADLFEQVGDGTTTRYQVEVTNSEPANPLGGSHIIDVLVEWDEESP